MIRDLFKSLEKNKKRIAFCINDKEFSYEKLLEYTNCVIAQLREAPELTSKVAGIVSYDSILTYASILACWHEGLAYVPINPNNPIFRNDLIIHQSGAEIILEAKVNDKAFLSADVKRIQLETISPPEKNFISDFRCIEGQLLYILFTSGSTGSPKGVPINENNIIAFLDSYYRLGINPDHSDRCLQMFDLSFDVSVASYLIPLMFGSSVYTVNQEGVKYLKIYKLLRDKRITYASLVPSVINLLKPYFSQVVLPDLKMCILTAEASSVDLVMEWSKCLPASRIINLYGPTEATIWCTGYFFDPLSPKSYNGMLMIGKEFKNVFTVICNENLEEVPVGSKGELCLSSQQLTTGYLNNPEKNNTSFFLKDGKRFYKTGDVCYKTKDDEIFYCGRKDHQVKIQGFRIELSEIEECARSILKKQAVVVSYLNKMNVNELALFYEAGLTDAKKLADELSQKLPVYMIPSYIYPVKSFPVNDSGKIDRLQLVSMVVNNG